MLSQLSHSLLTCPLCRQSQPNLQKQLNKCYSKYMKIFIDDALNVLFNVSLHFGRIDTTDLNYVHFFCQWHHRSIPFFSVYSKKVIIISSSPPLPPVSFNLSDTNCDINNKSIIFEKNEAIHKWLMSDPLVTPSHHISIKNKKLIKINQQRFYLMGISFFISYFIHSMPAYVQ